MISSVGKQKQELVLLLAFFRADISQELLKDGSEVSGFTKINLWQRFLVSVNDFVDSLDFGVCHDTVYSEAVIDFVDAHVARDSTEAKDRESLS